MSIMEHLKSWLKAERGRSSALARHLGVPPSFVVKISEGERPIPVAHGAAIEQFTGGHVTRREMFPTTWRGIWPELDTPPTPTPAPLAQGAEQAAAGDVVCVGHGKNFCASESHNATQQGCGGLR